MVSANQMTFASIFSVDRGGVLEIDHSDNDSQSKVSTSAEKGELDFTCVSSAVVRLFNLILSLIKYRVKNNKDEDVPKIPGAWSLETS